MKLVYITFILMLLNACEGWYIAGYSFENSETEPTEFNSFIETDSTNQSEVE